ncbi:hypothetical protein [Saccharomonospora sp. CUA-673]|uniref:hypothetical protein n=1 Tax=Saccharomonospora sp. CUA-673 TaxID=1904969 RepID=UPI001115479A|nr:hypothetical protein [Saccharomonospora sp. CUA-673]
MARRLPPRRDSRPSRRRSLDARDPRLEPRRRRSRLHHFLRGVPGHTGPTGQRAGDAVDPASPIAALLRTAPRIDPADDPADRVADTVRTHRPGTHGAVTTLATSRPGQFVRRFRATVYDLLGLSPPTTAPEDRPVPAPAVALSDPRTTFVRATIESTDPATFALERRPSGSLRSPSTDRRDSCLVVDAANPRTEHLPLADVIVHHAVADAESWTTATLAALPGCQLAAARDRRGWLIAGVDGQRIRVPAPASDGALLAPALRAWLADDRKLAELPATVTVRSGARDIRATLEPADP